jgi:type IV secretory pathway VirB4 component
MALNAKPSQDFVPIADIKNGVIVLKDGSLRAVLVASSINFALKSEDERNAILLQFQDFLNSLDFSLQIQVQSRRFDIRPYLALLEERKKHQMNDLMKIQVDEYMGFVKALTEQTNIMSKHFFIIVPYSGSIINKTSGFGLGSLFGKRKNDNANIEAEDRFTQNQSQLEQRLAVVEQGLVRTGVRVARLGTEEIVELFYKIFNPGEAQKAISIS